MGTFIEEGLDDEVFVVEERQLELKANLGLATGTRHVPVVKQAQVHCIFLFLQLKVSTSCTAVFLGQKKQPSLVGRHFLAAGCALESRRKLFPFLQLHNYQHDLIVFNCNTSCVQ